MKLLSTFPMHACEKIALRDQTHAISYGALSAMIEERARRLDGFSCVALAMDNGVEWVLWDLAAMKAGVVLVPLPPFFTESQSQHALQSSGCTGMITAQGIQKLPFTPVALPPGTVKITYTSGTTGTPKGVCLPLPAMENIAASLVSVLGRDMAGMHCSVLPLGVLLENVAGIYAALMAGGTIFLPSLKDFGEHYQNLHAVVKQSRATSLILVPEILRALMMQVKNQGALPDLKFMAVGGAKVSPALILQARALGLPVYEGYGLSECASVVSLNVPGCERPGTTGAFLPHIDAVIEQGEIIIRNPGFLGYVGAPHAGPHATGDLGEIDKDGFITITGRRKNVLITSFGRNVSPEWVESALLSQPEILQAFVYGDAQPHLSALIVPASPQADIATAVKRANATLPDYAQLHHISITAPFTRQDGTLTGNGRMRRVHILETRTPQTETENTMKFYDRLIQETKDARESLYHVPQLADGLRGDISKDTYIAYLSEAYHHVRHTVRFMMAMGVRLPENRKWLHDAISEYIEEEKGHEEWILNDIAAAGGDKEAARAATPNLETQVLVAYNYDYIARKNPVGFLGMVFMLESTSTQIANMGADAVKTKLGLPQSAFTYLYSHGALDIEHLKFFEALVNKIDDPQDQAAIIEVANNTFRLFANLMRAIPHERVLKNVA